VLFIRAQSVIRADGAPSAQALARQFDLFAYIRRCARSDHCALARANPVFGTDEKRIRTKNRVIDKSNDGLGLLLSKIADCVRMCFSSARNR
jgi:hypothetical protein